eukprot:6491019-Amphidinium_carterae.3
MWQGGLCRLGTPTTTEPPISRGRDLDWMMVLNSLESGVFMMCFAAFHPHVGRRFGTAFPGLRRCDSEGGRGDGGVSGASGGWRGWLVGGGVVDCWEVGCGVLNSGGEVIAPVCGPHLCDGLRVVLEAVVGIGELDICISGVAG